MANKRDLLLQIKHDIEYIYNTGNLGGLTPQQANEVLDIYSNYLLMNKAGETIQQAVANWYKRYAWVVVEQHGVGWLVYFKPIRNATI